MFKPLTKNELIVGAVGVLQFDVVAFRLRDEYRAECMGRTPVPLRRWIRCDDEKMLAEFRKRMKTTIDGGGYLAYRQQSSNFTRGGAGSVADVVFGKTREH